MTHKLDSDDLFIHRVQERCAQLGMNFFLVEPTWVEGFHLLFEQGKVWTRGLLNMHSEHHEPTDIYHRLVLLASERGCKVIDPPHLALSAFDKAALHPRLALAGINVPSTVIVAYAEAEQYTLQDEHRQALGTPFVIKPAMGYGRRGVVLDATNERDIARSIAAWPDRHYLLQQRIVPRILQEGPAYFRVYYAFEQVWCCWWNCFSDHYRMVTESEVDSLQLQPLEIIVRRIAALTGMKFFSSEIAQTEAGKFVVIDYVNDQCHMLSQTASPHLGVPDELVASIARRLVDGAKAWIDQS